MGFLRYGSSDAESTWSDARSITITGVESEERLRGIAILHDSGGDKWIEDYR